MENVEEIHTLLEGSITLRKGPEMKGKVAQQTRNRGIFFQDGNGQLKIYGKRSVKALTQSLSSGLTQFTVVERHIDRRLRNHSERIYVEFGTGFERERISGGTEGLWRRVRSADQPLPAAIAKFYYATAVSAIPTSWRGEP